MGLLHFLVLLYPTLLVVPRWTRFYKHFLYKSISDHPIDLLHQPEALILFALQLNLHTLDHILQHLNLTVPLLDLPIQVLNHRPLQLPQLQTQLLRLLLQLVILTAHLLQHAHLLLYLLIPPADLILIILLPLLHLLILLLLQPHLLQQVLLLLLLIPKLLLIHLHLSLHTIKLLLQISKFLFNLFLLIL